MPKRVARTGLAVAASTAALVCAMVIAAPTASASSGSGESNVCSAVGAPSTTQTVGVTGVFHVTVFTCGNAQATGFQQCPAQTVAVPDVLHATLFYCVPLQLTAGANGENQSVTVGGVGGVSAGTG